LFSRKTGIEKIKLLLVYRFSLSFRIDEVIKSAKNVIAAAAGAGSHALIARIPA